SILTSCCWVRSCEVVGSSASNSQTMVDTNQQCLGAAGASSGCRREIEWSSAQGRLARENELTSVIEVTPHLPSALERRGDAPRAGRVGGREWILVQPLPCPMSFG